MFMQSSHLHKSVRGNSFLLHLQPLLLQFPLNPDTLNSIISKGAGRLSINTGSRDSSLILNHNLVVVKTLFSDLWFF